MHLYDSRFNEFIPHAKSGYIADLLADRFMHRLGHRAGDSEINSWRNSLKAFAKAVDDVGMDDSWLVLEYQLPLSSSRIDCMMLGTDARSARNAVLLEFKQWDNCEAYYLPEVVRVGGKEELHPSAQAAAYRKYLGEAHSAFVEEKIGLHSAAFLHNLRDAQGSNFHAERYASLLADTPAYTAADTEQLARYIGERTRFGADRELVDSVLDGAYQPSRKLLENVAKAVDGHRPWTLLDKQRIVYSRIVTEIREAHRKGTRHCIIVRGGPGTGKSVIALQVIGAAAHHGYTVAHATGSKAFTTNLKGIVGRGAEAVFRSTHQFRDAAPGSVDLIVCDEAHRLRRMTQFGPNIYSRRPQAEEIIDAAKVSVFLLDQAQSVRLNEVGSVWGIKDYADSQDVPTSIYDLDAQFRCAGSEGYIHWIEHVFGLRDKASTAWRKEYDVRVFDDVAEMEQAIRRQAAQGNGARLVAGFCWEWSDPRPDNSLVDDVRIGDWSMPWNRKPPEMRRRGKGTAPAPANHPYTIWATQPQGINEVGCIYSAQGFEFDYVGLIVGRDLVWDSERRRWRANLDANKDNTSFKTGLRKDEQLAVQQLSHVYRVLATRGMKGTYFHFLDTDTRRYFEKLLAG